jgi:hypothetical protein
LGRAPGPGYNHPVTAAEAHQEPADGQVGGSPPSAFERQMRVSPDPDVPGRYQVDVDARWNCPDVPQGGIMAALAASAMAREIDRPDQRLRTLSTVFALLVPGR